MTNRLGRVIDRVRTLHRELPAASSTERDLIFAQVRILDKRANLLRQAIIWGSISVLLVALLIITLFLGAILRLDAGWLVLILFSGCLITLIVSLLTFIRDINQTLYALRLELEEFVDKSAVDR
jgi:hypothetical protein